ncbi:MAG: DUF1890 domain-containing protein [Methanomicrobiales archaeon]|nr:DUF1890 domain-containing protein [Methanomicrobiales archaeon]
MTPTPDSSEKVALLVLGCPEVPVQTSIALYLMAVLRRRGIHPVVAGTKAARALLDVADSDRHYVGELIDLDQCIGEIAEKRRDADLCFVFIHKDAGISYAATLASLLGRSIYALVFGDHAQELADQITFPAHLIVARATHNPGPLKHRIDSLSGEWG